VHVEGSVDPIRDAETVETELMLADLDSLERRAVAVQKRARGGDREARLQLELIEPALAALRDGRPARLATIPAEWRRELAALQLLTAKPIFYIANVDEEAAPAAIRQAALSPTMPQPKARRRW
jgi:ribosome-binding ATPase YchF (GTP1/OBG family)